MIRLLEDIESQAESRRVITCWSEGQEPPSSTARKNLYSESQCWPEVPLQSVAQCHYCLGHTSAAR